MKVSHFGRTPLGYVIALTLCVMTSVTARPAMSAVERPAMSLVEWQASWIWAPEDQGVEMLLARKAFALKQKPESAILRISASSVYKLYLNGEYVRRGPARSAPHHQAFDEFDVSEFLKKGQNVMAVRIHYQNGSIAYHHEGRAGLLAQLDLMDRNGREWTVVTDESWKVMADPAWSNDSPLMSRFHLEVRDHMDLRKALGNWTALGFNDTSWGKATELMRSVGWPSVQSNADPQVLTPPWTRLESRQLPLLKEEPYSPVREMDGTLINLDDLKFLKSNKKDLQLFLYDFGEIVNGVPQLELQGTSGSVVHVMCAPYLVYNKFTPYVIQSELIDQIELSGKQDNWEAMYFKPTRYLAMVVEGAEKPIHVGHVGIRSIEYPFELSGKLKTPDDPWFEACWSAAAKTIDKCTTDAYTDNYRERRQYVQTAYYAAIGNYWTFGDSALMRRCLKQAAEEQQANGLMPAYAPQHGDNFMVILDSNTAWLRGLHDYLLYTGDYETVRDLMPAGHRLMKFLLSYTNEDGMLYNPPYSYWLDHAVLDRRGANMCMNGHFLGAMEDWAELLEWMQDSDADRISSKADQLKISLRKKLWNEERGLFCDALIDGKQSTQFSEHANAMALAAGVATQKQADRVASELLKEDTHDYINRESGLVMVTPAMSYHMHDGLAKYGYAEESLQLFKDKFGFMLEEQYNGTLWEEWFRGGSERIGMLKRKERTRSDAQTESAFPPALFGRYILGVQPTQPGCKEVEISLPDCGMNQMSGALETPHGLLRVAWELQSGKLSMDVPDGIIVKLNFKTNSKITKLNRGKHHVEFK
ncbi:MAG: alpha-L-rhamnosidase N-terminal domain-containing protein [Puniceicoccaceae bacterium]